MKRLADDHPHECRAAGDEQARDDQHLPDESLSRRNGGVATHHGHDLPWRFRQASGRIETRDSLMVAEFAGAADHRRRRAGYRLVEIRPELSVDVPQMDGCSLS